MKVLQLCSLYGDKFLESLMLSIESNNVEISVFYPRRYDKEYQNENKNVVSDKIYNRLDGILYYSKILKILVKLEKSCLIEEKDIVHAHTLYTDGVVAYYLYRKYGVPYIVAVRSTDLNYYYKYRKDLFFLARAVLKNAKNVIFLSESYLIKTEIYFKLNLSTKGNVIPNGISARYLENLRKDLRKDERKNIEILTVGFISRRKNQLSVAKAIHLLNSKYNQKINYNVIGKILDENVHDELMSYEFVSYYEFMDKSQLIEMYREADIFVMPSLSETFGLTYLEAISQNVPVIYTKNEGFDGHFPLGKVGYSVEAKNIEDIAKKIMMILENYSQFENISYLVKDFEWNKISLQYKKIYEDSLL